MSISLICLFVFMLDEGLLRVSRVCVIVHPTCSLLHIPVSVVVLHIPFSVVVLHIPVSVVLHIPVSVVVYTCPLLQLRLC